MKSLIGSLSSSSIPKSKPRSIICDGWGESHSLEVEFLDGVAVFLRSCPDYEVAGTSSA